MGVFSQEGTSTPFFIETNARGDVIALRDRDGATFATYAYEVYGAPKAQGTSTCTTDKIPADLAQRIATAQILRYAGYTYDNSSGRHYCSQRYYDPSTQAFISLDPAQADGQRSGYLYCAGDPVNNVDLSGEEGKVLTRMKAYNQGSNPTCFFVALQAILEYVKGAKTTVGKLKKQGFENDVGRTAALDNISLLKSKYKLRSKYNPKLSYTAVKTEINNNRPIMALGSADTGRGWGGHAYNIIGYRKARHIRQVSVANWGSKRWKGYKSITSEEGVSWIKGARIKWERTWYGFKK